MLNSLTPFYPIAMKKNPVAIIVVAFVAGILLGVSTLGLLSFTGAVTVPAPVQATSKISLQDAQSLFRNYFSKAAPTNAVFKGFALNKAQLGALNSLSAENPNLAGFRIYMGMDNSNASVGIIVGIDNTGKDNMNSIYKASAGPSGPCPTICDGTSGITAN